MTADAQLTANYSAIISPTHAVSFFRSTPRWPSATRNFDLSYDYFTPVALTALIPVIAALAVLLALLLLLAFRYTCRRNVVNARILRWHRSRKASALQIAVSVPLTALIFLFLALGFISVASLDFAAEDALDVINGLVADISRAGFTVVDTLLFFTNRLNDFTPDPTPPSNNPNPTLEDYIQPALASAKTFVQDRYPNVRPLRVALQDAVTDIEDLLDVVRKGVAITTAVLVAILVLMLSAPLLLAAVDALPLAKQGRGWRVGAHILFLLVPSLLSWAMVGIASAVGATVADMCTTVHEFRDVLLGTLDAADVPANALVDANVRCPDLVSAAALSDQFDGTVESVLQSSLAQETIQRLLGTTAERVAATAEWTKDEVTKYVDCSALISFSGKLEFAMCAKAGRSALQSVFDIWVAFVGLSMLLLLAMVLSLGGVRVAWALVVWPRRALEEQLGAVGLTPRQRRDLSEENSKYLEDTEVSNG